MKPVIQLHKLTKHYGSAVGIENVSLAVPQGSVFGFLGPNGAGKTTTISTLTDFIRPTSGWARLFGLDSQHDSLEIQRRIGFLTGDMALDSGLTGWQQLEYLGNLHGKFDRDYVAQLAERLDSRLDRRFKKLSRGNRQKIGLIAALMHRPELLILDEPTSGLDPLIQAEFNKIILEHQAGGGTTFISSHVLSEVQEICDTITFIRNGRLADTMSMADIAKRAGKRVVVGSTNKQLIKRLQRFDGLAVHKSSDSKVEGTYAGDINDLMRVLAGYRLERLVIEDADLGDTFMKYYEAEEGADNA